MRFFFSILSAKLENVKEKNDIGNLFKKTTWKKKRKCTTEIRWLLSDRGKSSKDIVVIPLLEAAAEQLAPPSLIVSQLRLFVEFPDLKC